MAIQNYTVLSPNFPPQIQKRIDKGKKGWSQIGKGWLPLVVALDVVLAEKYPDYTINQCKEKFGGLRFYAGGIDEDGQRIINEYENESFKICDVCGKPGETIPLGRGWMATRCKEHAE